MLFNATINNISAISSSVNKRLRKLKGKGQSGMDNTETLAEFGTQDTEEPEREGTIRNGQHRDTGRIWYTRHRENRRGRDNQEWTTQRH